MHNKTEASRSSAMLADEAPLNQSPVFEDVNLFQTDRCLKDALGREGAGWAMEEMSAFGALAGSAHILEQGRLANENLPKLRVIDQKGHRLDQVEFHPAYHELMTLSFKHGLHLSALERDNSSKPRHGVMVARAAKYYMLCQAEAGHLCPITMTHAAHPSLTHNPDLLAELLPKLTSRKYDASFRPIPEKEGITIGMGMTEKQGGTDVRANLTEAKPLEGDLYSIHGHKWFMSAPMCDAFLVLAQAPGGLTCFFLPRFRVDGSLNAIRIERLKDKLGNKSNASSEVTFLGAEARRVGEEGRGVPAIIEMVTATRLDCAVTSASLMRFGLANALRHTKHRTVFQRKLIDQPMMRTVLSDMALDVEAATALAFRLAASFDRYENDPQEAAFRRLITPVAKYWICKTAPAFLYEAMECLGGNGYVEEGWLARAYREAPLNAIWEGSGNVMCLDLLRVMQREPETIETVLSMMCDAARANSHIRTALLEMKQQLTAKALVEADARQITERLATLVAASLLVVHAPAVIAEPFAATRLAGGWRYSYGASVSCADRDAILARAGEGL